MDPGPGEARRWAWSRDTYQKPGSQGFFWVCMADVGGEKSSLGSRHEHRLRNHIDFGAKASEIVAPVVPAMLRWMQQCSWGLGPILCLVWLWVCSVPSLRVWGAFRVGSHWVCHLQVHSRVPRGVLVCDQWGCSVPSVEWVLPWSSVPPGHRSACSWGPGPQGTGSVYQISCCPVSDSRSQVTPWHWGLTHPSWSQTAPPRSFTEPPACLILLPSSPPVHP